MLTGCNGHRKRMLGYASLERPMATFRGVRMSIPLSTRTSA